MAHAPAAQRRRRGGRRHAPAPPSASLKTIDQLLEEARASLPRRLSATEAAQALGDGALLIDIRSDDQRRTDGLIPGATVIPRNTLEWRCDPASAWRHSAIRDHEQRLVLVCNEGFQSSLAAATLQQLGMRHATDVDGGFVAWRDAGLPVLRIDSEAEASARRSPTAESQTHWDAIYVRAGASGVSWYQSEPSVSLELIEALRITPDAAVLDVGGGASTLSAALVQRGFRDVTVVDVSERALAACAENLAPAKVGVRLVHDDLMTWTPLRRYDLWHDRAVLHFFVDPVRRARYVDLLRSAVSAGGKVIIGVFADDGPERCSGLPVIRYSLTRLAALIGEGFELAAERRENHTTPAGIVQAFQWVAFARKGES